MKGGNDAVCVGDNINLKFCVIKIGTLSSNV